MEDNIEIYQSIAKKPLMPPPRDLSEIEKNLLNAFNQITDVGQKYEIIGYIKCLALLERPKTHTNTIEKND
jgi:hypothetical protein